jgi:hypothetical protein
VENKCVGWSNPVLAKGVVRSEERRMKEEGEKETKKRETKRQE